MRIASTGDSAIITAAEVNWGRNRFKITLNNGPNTRRREAAEGYPIDDPGDLRDFLRKVDYAATCLKRLLQAAHDSWFARPTHMLTDEEVQAEYDAEHDVEEEGDPESEYIESAEAAALNDGMMLAAITGNGPLATYLIQKGAADARGPGGETALMAAAQAGHLGVVRLLIERLRMTIPNFVNAKNEAGETALHAASQRHAEAVVTMLIEAGASVDLVNRDGDTPLLLAAEAGSASVVSLLLENGACVDSMNRKCHTVLSRVALRSGAGVLEHTEWQRMAVSLIENKGASLAQLLSHSEETVRHHGISFCRDSISAASMAAQAAMMMPLLEADAPTVRAATLEALQNVNLRMLVRRSTTIVRMLVRLNRSYTGVLHPLRAYLFPAVASQRAFVTRRAFITAIAGRREDTNVRVQEAANKCVGKHFNLSEIGADVLVAAALSRDD
jgi:ankyrin repeat protein